MKYSKREVRDLLCKGTHVLCSDNSDGLKNILIDMFPEDRFFQNGGTFSVMDLYISFKSEWGFSSSAEGRVVIHLKDIVEEVIWLGSEVQIKLISSDDWHNCSEMHVYRLKPNKELELEILAEELGYNLTKK
jgi:hypothetical protein